MALAVCSAAISLLLLIACPVALAASQHGVSIKVFTPKTISFGRTPSSSREHTR